MRYKNSVVHFSFICLLALLTTDAFAGKIQLPKETFSTGEPLSSQDLQNNFDTLATEATPTQSGLMSAADKAKLDSISGSSTAGGLNCQLKFDFVEQGTSTKDYWPSAAERAELLQYGWICWNRRDITAITPITAMVHSAVYTDWIDAAGNPTLKNICGRITRMNYLAKSFYVWSPGYYYGLSQMDNTSVVTHGVWADNGVETTGPDGLGDYWGIYTCR